MKAIKTMTIMALICAAAFQLHAQTCDWSELIGKKLVLYRYGRMTNGYFSAYTHTNPAGLFPVENLTLVDSTHFEWKNSLSEDATKECKLNGSVMEIDPPFWNNSHLPILLRNDNVVVTRGEDGITRAFFIEESLPAPEALPASLKTKNGFCNGKLDNLMPQFTDFTYHSATPMGRHFIFCKEADSEQTKWLESTEEFFNSSWGTIKTYKVKLYPHGKPVMADVNQKVMNDCNFLSVMADMAFQYPKFIKSIIHQESAESFRVDMYDPMGKKIQVRVGNSFPMQENGIPMLCVGKDDQPNWITILEKAVMKWIKVYRHINTLEGTNAEWITPLFTGDGRSFCVQPSKLSSQDLTRVINTCLEHGMMVNGGFLKNNIPLDGGVTISKHGHSFLPPQKAGALYSIRNPHGTGKNDGIMNLMPDNQDVPSLIDIRIISPGAAAKYFKKK